METIKLEWVSDSNKESLQVIADDPAYEWSHSSEYFEELVYFKRALIAYEAGQPVGYLLFQVLWGNTPFLSQIWMYESQRGKGLGRQMVALLEERLRSEGYDSLVTSNETKNNGGVGFVKNLGFKEIGKLEMHHGPEVFSVKSLR